MLFIVSAVRAINAWWWDGWTLDWTLWPRASSSHETMRQHMDSQTPRPVPLYIKLRVVTGLYIYRIGSSHGTLYRPTIAGDGGDFAGAQGRRSWPEPDQSPSRAGAEAPSRVSQCLEAQANAAMINLTQTSRRGTALANWGDLAFCRPDSPAKSRLVKEISFIPSCDWQIWTGYYIYQCVRWSV